MKRLTHILRHCTAAVICISALCAVSCGNPEKTQRVDGKIEYADYLQIYGDTVLSVNNWESANLLSEKYLLVPRDCTEILNGNIFAIPVPVKSCVAMSTTYLPHLGVLGCAEVVKAASGTAFVYDGNFRELITKGVIHDIGSETAPDYEKILSLKPDLILAYGVSGSDNSYIRKFRSLGVKVLVINDYLENDPLAKLEYIKLFGALTGRQAAADSIFGRKSLDYLRVKKLVEDATGQGGSAGNRTKVLMNLPYKDIWYIPGAENYMAKLVKDAGGEILGAKEGVSISSRESFERMYSLGMGADVWIHLNSLSRKDAISAENRLYANFPLFKNGRLFNNTKRMSAGGGSDFWESGSLNPDIILSDLVQIFHPEIAREHFPERELVYYLPLE